MTDRTLILGAAGIIGRGIARRLAADGTPNLVLADVRSAPVEALARELNAEATTVDVSDRSATAHTIRGGSFTVNATLYNQNLTVMQACLDSNSSYLDLGGMYHTTLRQLEEGGKFEKAGLLAVLGAGKAPGITNVLAAHGAGRFDRISTVHLRSGRRSLDQNSGVTLPYSAQTLLDEFTLRPMVFSDGAIGEAKPLSGRETVNHGAPFGSIEYITTLHSELATLPGFLGRGVQSIDFKVGLSRATAEALESLVRLGFASSEPVSVGGSAIRPRDLSAALLSKLPLQSGPEVWLTEVEMQGSKEENAMRLLLRVSGTEAQNGTALAAAATVALYRRGSIRGTGVVAPEIAIPSQQFLDQLRSYGLSFTQEEGA